MPRILANHSIKSPNPNLPFAMLTKVQQKIVPYICTIMIQDYMKYWRVIRHYALTKYDLSTAELDMMFFLKTERLFTRKDFVEYNKIFAWDRKRFEKLLQKGLVEVFRKSRHHRMSNVYQVSLKGRNMLNDIYQKMEGAEFSEDQRANPFFKSDPSFKDKVYRNQMKKINEAIRQGQHL